MDQFWNEWLLAFVYKHCSFTFIPIYRKLECPEADAASYPSDLKSYTIKPVIRFNVSRYAENATQDQKAATFTFDSTKVTTNSPSELSG